MSAPVEPRGALTASLPRAVEVTPAYRVEVARRDSTHAGYADQPFSATVYLGARVVALQYGATAGQAFQQGWDAVQADREREAVIGHGASDRERVRFSDLAGPSDDWGRLWRD